MVTMPMEHVRGRYAFGMYKQMEHFDLIASSVEEYTGIAVKLLTDEEYRHNQSALVSYSLALYSY